MSGQDFNPVKPLFCDYLPNNAQYSSNRTINSSVTLSISATGVFKKFIILINCRAKSDSGIYKQGQLKNIMHDKARIVKHLPRRNA